MTELTTSACRRDYGDQHHLLASSCPAHRARDRVGKFRASHDDLTGGVSCPAPGSVSRITVLPGGIHMFASDPLVPPSVLLPLADTRGGGQRPVEHVPGSLRPFSATLAVVPIPCGKHHTTATRWDKTENTQKSRDGVVEADTVVIPQTDT